MPAATYPDLVLRYPPAQRRLRPLSQPPALPEALTPSTSLGGSRPGSSASRSQGQRPARGLSFSASAPGLAAAARPRPRSPVGSATAHLWRHPVQCGHPPTLKTSYSLLDHPVAMAQDPRWSTDLAKQSQDMRRTAFMNARLTAGFLPSPVPYQLPASASA
mmetsp:Transcript_27566/g.83110  ORF Transcript_27566/g.83110 Transcript_27566/m.83110 type:complete len:161 (+) Transcript_27566:146-628(+)